MTRTCQFEIKSHKEFSIESLQSQENPWTMERFSFETLYSFKVCMNLISPPNVFLETVYKKCRDFQVTMFYFMDIFPFVIIKYRRSLECKNLLDFATKPTVYNYFMYVTLLKI